MNEDEKIARQIRISKQKIKNLKAELEQERYALGILESLSRATYVSEKRTIESHIVEILSGGPMKVACISEALEAAGVSRKSKNGLKPTVTATLHRLSLIHI